MTIEEYMKQEGAIIIKDSDDEKIVITKPVITDFGWCQAYMLGKKSKHKDFTYVPIVYPADANRDYIALEYSQKEESFYKFYNKLS